MLSPVLFRRAVRALSVALILLLAGEAQAAFALTVRVDDDRAQCPGAAFRSISAALRFVGPGGTVVVCPGTYFGPLRIARAGVRVIGLTGNAADVVVEPNPRLSASVVPVDMSAPATTLAAVTVRDGVAPRCGTRDKVVVDNGAGPFARAAVIDNVTVRAPVGGTVGPCPPSDAVGLTVGGTAPGARAGRAVVRNSRLLGGRSSVRVGAESTASIHDDVVGSGLLGVGIDVLGTARIERNDISGQATGISAEGHATIGGAPGRGNNIHENGAFGLAVRGDAVVANNAIHDNGNTGVLVGAPAVVLVNNAIRRNGFSTGGPSVGLGVHVGIRVELSTGAVVAGNDVRDNFSGGIVVLTAHGDSSANRFLFNVAINNDNDNATSMGDCFDATTGNGTAGTANTWIGNIGARSVPRGICAPPGPPPAPNSPPA